MKIAFHTLGCKVNQYETEAIAEKFRSRGYEITAGDEPADVYIINTCTVTGVADRKSRQYIRRAKKLNPESIVAVTGCFAQMNPEETADIEGVDIVVGNDYKQDLPEYIESFLGAGEYREYQETGDFTAVESRTSAYIKVQDGCDRFCSYCVIPYARGEARSRSIESILREAETLISKGYKEIVLTGINTALYGNEPGFCGEAGIGGLAGKLNAIPGDFRIRLSSLEPTVIDAEYVKRLFKYDKLCHHIHLSLQSGSDRILKAMNRKYSLVEYMEIVRVLKEFDPDYGISTDIIAGFPGESADDFRESVRAVENAGFCKIHVFKYSNRKGTVASGMSDQVSGSEKKLRSGELIKRGKLSERGFFEKNSGKTRRVLVEEYIENEGLYTGYTDNYIKVYINKNYVNNAILNEFVDVKLAELFKDGMRGKPE